LYDDSRCHGCRFACSNERWEKEFSARLKIRVSAHIGKKIFNRSATRCVIRPIKTAIALQILLRPRPATHASRAANTG
jgi:hypothetical protein